jgi:hypothetical protein
VAKTNNGFKSAAHRAAVFATDPALGRNIASKYGAKVGGGFTKAQIARRKAAAARGDRYQPKD